jgi:hypothetical protein
MTSLDELLTESLESAAHSYSPEEPAARRSEFAARRRRRRGLRATGVVATAAALIALAVLAATQVRDRSALPPAARPVLTQTTRVGERPAGLFVDRSTVWVANRGDGTLARVDSVTGRVRVLEPLGGLEAAPVGVTVHRGFVFATDELSGTMLPVDPRTGAAPTQLTLGPRPGDVVANAQGVWAAASAPTGEEGAVYLSAPASEEEGSDAPELPVAVRTNGIPQLAASSDAVWVADGEGAFALRVVDGSVERGATVPIEGAVDVAVGTSAVWVATDAGALLRIDPERLEVTGEVAAGVGADPRIAIDEDRVWVVAGSEGSGRLVAVETRTMDAGVRLDLRGGPFEIAAGANAAWVTDAAGGFLHRIEVAPGG